MRHIVLIAHNIRSSHNVGSLLRTAEGLGVETVFMTGYTPYPLTPNDKRLPYISQKVNRAITKTALGAEASQAWEKADYIEPVLSQLRDQGYIIAALEQTANSQTLDSFQPPTKIAIIAGNELEGIEAEVIQAADLALAIPMFGKKESFNVAQAAAMAIYHCRFYNM